MTVIFTVTAALNIIIIFTVFVVHLNKKLY